MAAKRKVCVTGPMRIKIVENTLRDSGCEVVLGKPQDDFRNFRYERKELINLVGDSSIIYPSGRDFIGGDVMDSCPNLQAVVKSSIGIETVDVDAATDLGILCCNSPTLENYLGVAEATMGLMIALFKRLKLNETVIRNSGWKELENRGTLMLGRTVGIIGVGRIGQAVAKRLDSWGMKVLGYDPYVKQETVASLGIKMVGLEELLKNSDAVTIHVVLTRETRGMIGMRELKMMKPTAFIINTARGGLINEADLLEALRAKRIAGAALDVFAKEPTYDTPFAKLDNCIVTPHQAGYAAEALERQGVMAVQNMVDVLEGRRPNGVVNPEVYQR